MQYFSSKSLQFLQLKLAAFYTVAERHGTAGL